MDRHLLHSATQPTFQMAGAALPAFSAVMAELEDTGQGGEGWERQRDRSRSPAPLRLPAEEPPDLSELLSKALGDKLPHYVYTQIQSLHKDFAENVSVLLKLRERNAKLKKDIDSLKNGVVPAGCRPYVPKKGFVGQATLKDDMTFSFTLSKGTSMDDCKRVLYVTNMLFNRRLDNAAQEMQIESLEEDTDYDNFIKECTSKGVEHSSTISNLGLRAPPGLFESSDDVTKEKATNLYVTTVHKIAEQVQKGQKAKDDQEQKRKAVVQAMATMDPEKKLDSAIDRRIEVKLGKKKARQSRSGFDVDYAGLAIGRDAESCVSAAPAAPQPKAKPKAAAKHKPSAKPKAKNSAAPPRRPEAKGTGKSKGDSKGKGKGKPSSKGKVATLPSTEPPLGPKGRGGKGGGKGRGNGRGNGGR